MTEQIRHSSNVVTATEQGRCERVAQGMQRGGLRDTYVFYGTLEGALKGLVIRLMAAHDDATWIGRMCVLRKDPKPRPRMSGARILPLKGGGKGHAAAALVLVLQPPARARASCSLSPGDKLSGNISARSLEPLPSRAMIVPLLRDNLDEMLCRSTGEIITVVFGGTDAVIL